MKIGLISDVHGNILALQKVFEEFKKIGVQKFLCAGDIIGLGPHPEEAVQFLKNEKDVISVKGNHEGYLLDGIPTVIHARKMTDEETNHHKWIHSNLSDDSKKYLSALPSEVFLEAENKKIYMVHYPISKFGIYKEFKKNPTKDDFEKLFSDKDADIYLYGHTHIFAKYQDENKLYLNLNSVGCPLKNNYAKFGILNIENGKVEYEDLEVNYDADKVRDEILKLDYPFSKKVLDIFY